MPQNWYQLLDGQYTPVTIEQVKAWRDAGWWEQRSLRSLLTDAAARHPERTALVGYKSDGEVERATYREYETAANQAASALASLGVQKGDAVAVMLPNWLEYAPFVFGINEISSIYVGIPVAYGPQQTLAILRRSKAKAIIVPRQHRSVEHLKMLRRIRRELPELQHVIVVDEKYDDLHDGEVAWDVLRQVPTRTFPDPDPGRVCYLGFTSGTTGEPKGAMHTHETILYAVRRQTEHVGAEVYGNPMIHLVASPAGHNTGFQWGIIMTTMLGGTQVHVDKWQAHQGAEIIRREGVTTFFGAPTFVQDLMRTDLVKDPECPLECLVVAGSSVPRNLPAQAGEAFGAYIAPAWGLTECGIMSSCTPRESTAIQLTDGSVFAGSRVRVVDASESDLPLDETGHLLMHGPGIALGYFDRPDATKESYTEDLWFRTGDTASLSDNGWLSLKGRTKDLIIRGGENIPVTTIESLLFDHPSIQNVAVVGVPDERLGEKIAAVYEGKPDVGDLMLDEVTQYLLEQGLSKHYLPEFLLPVVDIPTTPSGKIQKFKLRELAIGQIAQV